MSKMNMLVAAALMVAAGSASAAIEPANKPWYTSATLYDGSKKSATYTSNTTEAAKYAVGKQTGAVLVDYSFSFTGTPKDNAFLGLWFGNSNGPNFGVKANCDGTCTDDVFLRLSLGNETYVDGSALTAGNTYHLVALLYKADGTIGTGSAYDSFKLWLNPTAYEVATLTGADAFASGGISLTNFSDVGFRTANISSSNAFTVSNVVITAVPEPASLALFGLAAAGLGVARRRKSA